jgi:carboxymethylenebutenolidase
VGACVPFYGIIAWPDAQPDYTKLSAAVLMHIAGNDAFFTPEVAAELESKLRGLGKDVELQLYPGTEHAFFNDTRPEVHDPEASALAWDRTLEFLRARLG